MTRHRVYDPAPTQATSFRVRYAETDQMAVVYHANYLVWFEVARVELMRAAGVPYSAWEARGFGLPVVEAHVRYIKPARYDERLSVVARLVERGHASLRIEYALWRESDAPSADATLLATGYTVHACVEIASGRPTRLPDALIGALEALVAAPASSTPSE